MYLFATVSPFSKTGESFRAGFWIFISLFAAFAIVHLIFCFLEKPFWRKLTKPFCLVMLGAAMAFLVPDYPLIYVSCWVSAVGDVLLIKNKDPKFFVTGAGVFAVAHTLNLVTQTKILSYSFPDYAWMIMAAVALIVAAVAYCTHGKKDVAISTVAPTYACFHLANIALAVMVLADGKFVPYKIMILLGYLVYVVSDMIVNYVTNKRDIKRRDFYIMLTYLAGQTLIYFGLALTLIA